MQLAKDVFGSLAGRNALLLGAGEMSKLAATHLRSHGIDNIYIASRTKSRVDDLADDLNGIPIDFSQFEDTLEQVDFLISSTSAPHPIITKDRMARVMENRTNAPIFLIDIAVPRDVAPNVAELDNVFVYNIDDLHFHVDHCRCEREKEIEKVYEIIDGEVAEFMSYLRTLDAMPLIKQLKAKFESVYTNELDRYSSKLAHLSEEDREYVRKLLRSTVNKLTYDPILRIKDYASNGQDKEKLDIVRELFSLPSPEDKE